MSQAFDHTDDDAARPRVAWVMHSVYNAKFFLVPHLRMLGEEHEVLLYLRNDAPEILETLDTPAQVVEIPIVRHVDPIADLKAIWALWRALRRDRPDLVHSTTPKGGLIGMLAAFLARVPRRVHTFQGEAWAHITGPKRTLFKFLDWLVVQLATEITVVSASERDFLRTNGVLKADQGIVLGSGSICGVDLNRFHPDADKRAANRAALGYGDDDLVVLYLGRLQRDKGLHVLQQALPYVTTQVSQPIKLLAVGPDEDGLGDALKQSLGDDARVLPYTETPEDAISAADLLVLPSFREGFGMVLIEAAAMGVPSVASRIYGITCAVAEDETGLLFDVGDAKDMARAIARLLTDAPLRHQLGQNGIARTRAEFAQPVVIEHFREFYRSQLAHQPHRSRRQRRPLNR